ncbi:hypothetical protein MRBLMR1_004853 [Neorhizobium sp. LMR1-1-1.1]
MSQPIRLVIVTDCPERAAPAIFGMAISQLPGWVLVMTDWQTIAKLEDGTPCMAFWSQKRGVVSLAEITWRERRQAVKLDDDFGRHFDRVTDWLDKRDAAEREILRQALAEMSDQEGVITFDELVQAQAAQRASESATIKKFPTKSRWS